MLLTKENILDALRNVEDPDLKKDLVTLGMIEDLEIDGLTIKFSVVLTTPACPLKDMLENACRNAIKHFVNKEAEIIINMTSRVTSAPQVLSKNIKNEPNKFSKLSLAAIAMAIPPIPKPVIKLTALTSKT